MTQQKADPVKVYERSAGHARSLMAGVKPDQLQKPTPCAEWDVAALLEHMVRAQGMMARTVSGGEPPAAGSPVDRLDAAVAAMTRALRAPGGLDKVVQGRTGEVPAAQILGQACTDLTIHCWDLAKATGQDPTLDDDVVDFIFPNAEAAAKRGPNRAYAPPVSVPPNASKQDRLIGLTGRKP